MFESDDFDQVLSQFEFPEVDSVKPKEKKVQSTVAESQDYIPCTNQSNITALMKPNLVRHTSSNKALLTKNQKEDSLICYRKENVVSKTKDAGHAITNISHKHQNVDRKANNQEQNNLPKVDSFVSPKHLKRKIINTHFDQLSKRKFPGPAGLLTGDLEEAKDDSIDHIEFLSQDMDFTESNARKDIFESPLWQRLLKDTYSWKVYNVDSIKKIKQQALSGNLRRRKAQAVTAFIEAVDRSVTDPLVILRDQTGTIKCTLHRDAWSNFSPYLVSDYCALVLQQPTVLTTGGAFKKHYLNITLSNILAIFSSAILSEEIVLPDGYEILYEEDFTVIKTSKCLERIDTHLDSSHSAEDVYDGLDNFFTDDIF